MRNYFWVSMIQSISIKNYALIDKLEMKLNSGFTIITGETGAGKSILLGALSLLLGERADISTIKNKDEKCIIEAAFRVENYNLAPFFKDNDMDYDATTIIRRVINPGGKSRAFVNDLPVNLNILKMLGNQLVDIHSQHQNLILNNPNFQLQVVDTIAEHQDLLARYRKKYKAYTELKKQYETITAQAEKAKADLDYYQHRFEQLDKANFYESEQEELEEELETLTHAEEIKSSLLDTFFMLSGDENSVIPNLKEGVFAMSNISSFFAKAGELHKRLDSAFIELKDIAGELEILGNDVEFNQERADFIKERLDLMYSLQQQHRVGSVKELLELKDELEKKIEKITNYDFEIEELSKQLKAAYDDLMVLAKKISENRKKTIPKIEKTVIRQLAELGIPNAQFTIERISDEKLTPNGIDLVNFLFSANKKMEQKPVAKVASGGEISRLMLSIKALISKSAALPTIIFDEIDAGVSGDIAGKMGNIFRSMGKNMQVINITHLPQVAAKGDYHFKVYKKDKKDTTSTQIKELKNNERVEEIAKMLSGENITEAAFENAKELLKG